MAFRGAAATPLPTPSTPLIVKALNAEIRLKNLGSSSTTACASMTLLRKQRFPIRKLRATVPAGDGGRLRTKVAHRSELLGR
jgi:hypothetical protein